MAGLPVGKEIWASGCQRSLRRAVGTVFLPLKGSWEREALFCCQVSGCLPSENVEGSTFSTRVRE